MFASPSPVWPNVSWKLKRMWEASGLLAPLVGHVGDGNFHMIFLVEPDSRTETEKAHFLSHRMVMRALKMGGTCTGEHGIGYGKLQYNGE